MKEVQGKYSYAKVFTDVVDEKSLQQIQSLCDQDFARDCRIRLMPDVHAGAGCTIGTTMTINDKIVPNLVGVDIGCGMEVLCIKADSEVSQNFKGEEFDKVIRMNIPSGFNIRTSPHKFADQVEWDKILGCLDKDRAKLSLGTLGGGNHFIEADRDDEGNLYIVVHSGSRHAGLEIANYYQEQAWLTLENERKEKSNVKDYAKKLKAEGIEEKNIPELLKEFKLNIPKKIPRDLAYVSGALFDAYINDMKIMQHFAMLNRKAMIEAICEGLHVKEGDVMEQFTTIHNYIDIQNMILRKGAVSAQKGEKLIIPINMRDGSLICVGKGNEDWNYSAPHGAGRLLSRMEAKEQLKLEEFQAEMSGVCSSSVNLETIDEAPMAYKKMEDIVNNIAPTAEIVKVIKPIYNFKAGEPVVDAK